MIENILVVCIGNICRSPVGAALMKEHFSEKKISSAGIHALVSQPAQQTMRAIGHKKGIDLNGHKAQQLTYELCQSADLILVMEEAHLKEVYRINAATQGKVMLLGQWLDNREIEDPYKRSHEMYQHVFLLIENAVNSWKDKI
jgi:protein-tyrosine phosphatase